MADEHDEKEGKEYKDIKKSHILTPFASPCNKRPFTKCDKEQEGLITKRTKYSSLVDDATPQSVEETVKRTTENRRELMTILRKKEDTLRKLNLVKMYRAKNNLSDLEVLITKWRSLSQTAAQDLYEKFSGKDKITMGQFLDGLRISHDLIKYSDEEESFF